MPERAPSFRVLLAWGLLSRQVRWLAPRSLLRVTRHERHCTAFPREEWEARCAQWLASNEVLLGLALLLGAGLCDEDIRGEMDSAGRERSSAARTEGTAWRNPKPRAKTESYTEVEVPARFWAPNVLRGMQAGPMFLDLRPRWKQPGFALHPRRNPQHSLLGAEFLLVHNGVLTWQELEDPGLTEELLMG